MNPVLQEMVDILNVENIEQNLYRGQNHKTEHVFGGQVLAQAIAAAYRTIETEHFLHSAHAYFLRAGDWTIPILYEVDRIRDGRSFTTRRVTAIQHGRAIFDMALSWQKIEPGLSHALPMPDVPPPEALRGDREVYLALAESRPEMKRFAFRFEAIDSRQVERIPLDDKDVHPPYKHSWLKTRDPLPDNPEVRCRCLVQRRSSAEQRPLSRCTRRQQALQVTQLARLIRARCPVADTLRVRSSLCGAGTIS